MAKATKMKSGNWRCQAYAGRDENGRIKRKSFTAATKREAELLARQYEAEKDVEKRKVKLSDVMRLYIDSKENILSPTTVLMYRSIMKNHIQELQEMDIYHITKQDIQQAINNETAKGLSSKTIKNINGLVSAVLNEYDISYRIKLPQKEKSQIRIPTEDELKRIIECAKEYEYEYMTTVILLASHEGLRRSEILGLEWHNIDFNNKTITISQALVQNGENDLVMKQPKSFSGNRTMPMFGEVYDHLFGIRQPKGRVVDATPRMVSHHYATICKKAGVEGVRLHDLRHYFASVMLALNVPDKYAMELMGHSSNQMLKQVYQHTMEQKQNEFNSKINEYFR